MEFEPADDIEIVEDVSVEEAEEGYDKNELKFLKKFCGRLLEESNETWEEHEMAKLVVLVQGQLRMSEKKFMKWLNKYTDPTPELLSCLGDNGMTIQSDILVQLLGHGTFDRVVHQIEQSFESELLDIHSDDILQSLYDGVVHRFTNNQMACLIQKLAAFMKTKQQCGRMMNIFVAHLTADEIIPIVVNMMHYETMTELKGSVDSLLDELPMIGAPGRVEIKAQFTLDEKGQIVESDEDEDGNLKGFVCSDEDVCSSAEFDSEEEFSDWIEDDEDLHDKPSRRRGVREEESDVDTDDSEMKYSKKKAIKKIKKTKQKKRYRLEEEGEDEQESSVLEDSDFDDEVVVVAPKRTRQQRNETAGQHSAPKRRRGAVIESSDED